MASLEHAALWVSDIEKCKSFYCKYFKGVAGPVYHNRLKAFTSYFITFDSGARLELMHTHNRKHPLPHSLGYAHLAFSLGSQAKVDALTAQFRKDNVEVVGAPRKTGDGYYESVVKDPEGNLIELTV